MAARKIDDESFPPEAKLFVIFNRLALDLGNLIALHRFDPLLGLRLIRCLLTPFLPAWRNKVNRQIAYCGKCVVEKGV